jgi:hypothetical protein
VKFFNPLGEGVWLATELEDDGDIIFGLADLGYPELGSWSLTPTIQRVDAGRDSLLSMIAAAQGVSLFVA